MKILFMPRYVRNYTARINDVAGTIANINARKDRFAGVSASLGPPANDYFLGKVD